MNDLAKPMDGTIQVVWLCGMGTACENQETPGEHRGDYGYEEAGRCRQTLSIDDGVIGFQQDSSRS
jgi:hypothetical protein